VLDVMVVHSLLVSTEPGLGAPKLTLKPLASVTSAAGKLESGLVVSFSWLDLPKSYGNPPTVVEVGVFGGAGRSFFSPNANGKPPAFSFSLSVCAKVSLETLVSVAGVASLVLASSFFDTSVETLEIIGISSFSVGLEIIGISTFSIGSST